MKGMRLHTFPSIAGYGNSPTDIIAFLFRHPIVVIADMNTHEAVPACWYGEAWERPRYLVEVDAPSKLILLLESHLSFPDLGGWLIPERLRPHSSEGPFQSHNGACNWLFADQHAKRLQLAATCQNKMWADRYPDRSNGCENLHRIAEEY